MRQTERTVNVLNNHNHYGYTNNLHDDFRTIVYDVDNTVYDEVIYPTFTCEICFLDPYIAVR